jgi:membrane protein DedA with SNARE-associated domain
MIEFIHSIFLLFADTIHQYGYTAIILLMLLESCFIPFPSEVVMIPAGYLASNGSLDFILVILSGVLGSILGASINYFIAYKYGISFFKKYGKYFLLSNKSLDKVESFFQRYGHISTFFGRLLPIIRQFISLPAGIAKMPVKKFIIFTAIGSSIWVFILVWLGFIFGKNYEMLYDLTGQLSLLLVLGISFFSVTYIYIKKKLKYFKKI